MQNAKICKDHTVTTRTLTGPQNDGNKIIVSKQKYIYQVTLYIFCLSFNTLSSASSNDTSKQESTIFFRKVLCPLFDLKKRVFFYTEAGKKK